MRICMFGAGAIGGHMAVRLARAGQEVSVVARGPQLEAIRTSGLRLIVGDEDLDAGVHASDTPSDLGPQDVIFVTVKSSGLAAVAGSLTPLATPQTRVVFLQNGLPWWYPIGLSAPLPPPDLPHFSLSDAFLNILAPKQLVGGSIYSANELVAPGVIVNNSPAANQVTLGPVTGRPDPVLDRLRDVLGEAGMPSSVPIGDIRTVTWTKLLINMCGSTLGLATGNKSSISRQDLALGAIYLRMMEEGLAIAAAHGFSLDGVVDPHAMLARAPSHKPSLLQDFEAGRPMELLEIVHAPQAFARAAGLETPSLDAVSAIITRLALDRGLLPDTA